MRGMITFRFRYGSGRGGGLRHGNVRAWRRWGIVVGGAGGGWVRGVMPWFLILGGVREIIYDI